MKSRVMSQRFAAVLQVASVITKNRDKPMADSSETHIATITAVVPWKIDICFKTLSVVTKRTTKIIVPDRNHINSYKTENDLSILDMPFF